MKGKKRGGEKRTAGEAGTKSAKWSATKLAAGSISYDELLAPISSNAPGGDLPVLGHARAVVIVTFCAKTTPANLSRTLAELGVDGISFQKCVFTGVRNAGYQIDIDDIPNSSDTKLIKVVSVIQNAPRANRIDASGRIE